MTLGQKIRAARIEQGMTQKELVGAHITRNMLSRIENDSATPSVRTLEYIAGRLKLPTGYFMADSRWSDGSSPDGLDEMRRAYREGRWLDCADLLEHSRDGTTDEGYLLRARAALAAARDARAREDYAAARQYADSADYYNRQGIYYSAELDAEMSLILAECALKLELGEFEENAREFERAVKSISFRGRYALARAEYLLRTGEAELALRQLERAEMPPEGEEARYLWLLGRAKCQLGQKEAALETLKSALAAAGESQLTEQICETLEDCAAQCGDFKSAYEYAAMRRKRDTNGGNP